MFLPVLLGLLGSVLLLVSTQLFINLAQRLSFALRLSPLIIGITVVSIGTSLPELTVSGIAVLKGDTGLALGNILGSNIINVFLVFAVGILIGKLRVGTTKTQKNILILLGITVLFLILYFLRVTSIVAGCILLFITLLVSVAEYLWGVNGRDNEDTGLYKKRKRVRFSFIDTGKLSGALSGVVIGGLLTVNSVEEISRLLGLSTTILGLSVTAIVTSLPELLTTIFSQKNKEEKITIGNLIGSNIYNLTLIGGIILFFSNWEIIRSYELILLILSALVFTAIVIFHQGKIIPKYIGVLLLGMFILYLLYLR